MGPVEVCNIALGEAGNRLQINSFTDGTPAANAAALFFTPKLQMLSRAARWDSFRAQIALTQLKAQVINGVTSADPPPQPWGYEYAWPSDCLKAMFIIPTANVAAPGTPLTTAPNLSLVNASPPTSIPFVVGTDFDSQGNPIKVIYTNLYAAQLIYVRDLTNFPDLWDSLFLAAGTATLAAYFIASLARDKAQMQMQISIAKSAIEQARAADANEAITSIDNIPDWMGARMTSAVPWAWNQTGPGGTTYGYGGWDTMQFPDGLYF